MSAASQKYKTGKLAKLNTKTNKWSWMQFYLDIGRRALYAFKGEAELENFMTTMDDSLPSEIIPLNCGSLYPHINYCETMQIQRKEGNGFDAGMRIEITTPHQPHFLVRTFPPSYFAHASLFLTRVTFALSHYMAPTTRPCCRSGFPCSPRRAA